MNVEAATMQMPWFEAQQAFRNYRTAMKEKRATRDDVALYRGLRALLRGRKVIDLNLAIGAGGRDPQGRPRLAVARADWPFVIADGTGSGVQFSSRPGNWGRKPAGEVLIPGGCFGDTPAGMTPLIDIRCRAQVPSIPPQHRPAGDLRDYHILFEAEWLPVPPKDPLLLKKIDGPFYVVLAAWDLTPLEQAILRQRL